MSVSAEQESMADYFFDLRGYRILEQALSCDEVQRLRTWLQDADLHRHNPRRCMGDWIGGDGTAGNEAPDAIGNVELHSYYQNRDGSNPSGIDDGVRTRQHVTISVPRLVSQPAYKTADKETKVFAK